MGQHNLSHAEFFSAGNAVALNKGANFPNNLRGLPVKLMAVETFAAVAAADPDGIATTQTPAAGGAQLLTLDGAFVTDGVATLPIVSPVSITAVGNETARTFTIIGLDANGRPQAEEIAGPNATLANGVKSFSVVTEIRVDDDTAAAVTAGQEIDQPRGLRAKAEGLSDFFVATEDGTGIPTGANFDPGNAVAQTGTNADQRADYTPTTTTAEVIVMYLADLSKEGIGENFTASDQATFSAI